MVLFHELIVDLAAFNESYFSIFNESERDHLKKIFTETCESNPFKFISMLSPEQHRYLLLWACQRSKFDVTQLKIGLKKFIKYIDNVTYDVYPKQSPPTDKKKKGKKLLF